LETTGDVETVQSNHAYGYTRGTALPFGRCRLQLLLISTMMGRICNVINSRLYTHKCQGIPTRKFTCTHRKCSHWKNGEATGFFIYDPVSGFVRRVSLYCIVSQLHFDTKLVARPACVSHPAPRQQSHVKPQPMMESREMLGHYTSPKRLL
jgi:hypothetical protein